MLEAAEAFDDIGARVMAARTFGVAADLLAPIDADRAAEVRARAAELATVDGVRLSV